MLARKTTFVQRNGSTTTPPPPTEMQNRRGLLWNRAALRILQFAMVMIACATSVAGQIATDQSAFLGSVGAPRYLETFNTQAFQIGQSCGPPARYLDTNTGIGFIAAVSSHGMSCSGGIATFDHNSTLTITLDTGTTAFGIDVCHLTDRGNGNFDFVPEPVTVTLVGPGTSYWWTPTGFLFNNSFRGFRVSSSGPLITGIIINAAGNRMITFVDTIVVGV